MQNNNILKVRQNTKNKLKILDILNFQEQNGVFKIAGNSLHRTSIMQKILRNQHTPNSTPWQFIHLFAFKMNGVITGKNSSLFFFYIRKFIEQLCYNKIVIFLVKKDK